MLVLEQAVILKTVYSIYCNNLPFFKIANYCRSGNFRVKNISAIKFSLRLIFVARAQQRKLNNKILPLRLLYKLQFTVLSLTSFLEKRRAVLAVPY